MRLLAVLLVALPLAGCSSAPTETDEVVMHDSAYHPDAIRVAPGTVVSFRNEDDVRHTATFEGGPSLNVPAGSTAQRAFPDAGEFAFHCEVHPSMRGTVTVG